MYEIGMKVRVYCTPERNRAWTITHINEDTGIIQITRDGKKVTILSHLVEPF